MKIHRAFLVAQLSMQETQVRSPGQEDPLEKEMATTPVFLPRKSHGQKNLADCGTWGYKRVRRGLVTKPHENTSVH